VNKGSAEECRSRYHSTAHALVLYTANSLFFVLRTRIYITPASLFSVFPLFDCGIMGCSDHVKHIDRVIHVSTKAFNGLDTMQSNG
jgi:hypothetical protein